MPKSAKIFIISLIVILSVNACANKKEDISITTLTVSSLMNEYKSNEVLADQQYKGKCVTVIGVIQSINSEFLGGPKISLIQKDDGSLQLNSVDCEFNREDKASLLSIKVGDHVKIKGIVKGQFLGSISMDNCQFDLSPQ
ncbi:MAG: hypothetical protein WCI90_04100 [Chlorobium sp.]|nr:MAG: hypothetical protein FDX17_01170 [Chlorobium sp.]